MANSVSRTHAKVRGLVITAMLAAVSIVLAVTPLGFVNIGFGLGVSATLMHIPVIVAALSQGMGSGMGVGLVFGAYSCYSAFTTPTPANAVFQNPLVSILPRLLIGPAAYFSCRLMMRLFPQRKKLAWGVGAAAGSLANVVLAMLIVQPSIFIGEGESALVALKAIGVLIATNGVAECVIAVILVMALMGALSRVKK